MRSSVQATGQHERDADGRRAGVSARLEGVATGRDRLLSFFMRSGHDFIYLHFKSKVPASHALTCGTNQRLAMRVHDPRPLG